MDRIHLEQPPIEDNFVPAIVPDDSSPDAIVTYMHKSITTLRSHVKEDTNFNEHLDLCLLKLREGNRLLSNLILCKKKRSHQAKLTVEKLDGPRQCLIYQQQDVERSIDEARHHPSLYLSIPLEDDKANHTGVHDMEIDEEERSIPIDDEHTKMLRRLQRELEGRKALSERLKASQDARELARSRLVLKRKELEKLRDQIENIIRAADPLCHTQQRLFSELKQRAERIESPITDTGNALEITSDQIKQNPLTVLFEKLTQWSEGQDYIQIQYHDEIEPGEDIIDNYGGEEEEEDRDSETGGARSIPEASQETIHRGMRLCDRFESSSRNLLSRRYSIAHVLITINQKVNVSIYQSGSILMAQLESIRESDQNMTWDELFSHLSNLDPALQETVPMDESKIGRGSNIRAFTWLQCLAGIIPSRDPYLNIDDVLNVFFSSIRSLIMDTSATQE